MSQQKERPILFSGPMVRAILAGTKTQTRRVLNPLSLTFPIVGWERWIVPPPPTYPHWEPEPQYTESGLPLWASVDADGTHREWRCPYGEPGDRLWVRETWRSYDLDGTLEGAKQTLRYRASQNEAMITWKPSIHMPRWASRISLEITEIRVQRVQDISDADAIAEGVTWEQGVHRERGYAPISKDSPVAAFRRLWNEINEARGYSWANNPWVWCISFKRISQAEQSAAQPAREAA